jgi:glycosyltransferase involved in cell wall biosynthesis
VGGVMRFSNEKNITLWLKVAKLITQVNNKVKFQIIGDGPQRSKIQKMIKKYHLSGVVTIHSPTKDVYLKMINFDVFLQTSLIEGLPNSLIEAQLLGIPVVATNAGGSAEAFINKHSGFICPPGDAKSLSEAVLILLRDREMNSEFSINARKYSISKFDIENIALEYMNLYNTVF